MQAARALRLIRFSLAAFFCVACQDAGELSKQKAVEHVKLLKKTIETDVKEVRTGLPEGAKHLSTLFQKESLSEEDAQDARRALEDARDAVQDLRVAKSTFFAIVRADGLIVRNDQDQDQMASKNMFAAFPELRRALDGKYVETRGSMPEASGVRDSPDGQWVAAQAVSADGRVRGLYVTGWSWSAYSYRLENAVRASARSELGERDKMPLIYVYMVVGKNVYGAPVSPQVNAEVLAKLDLGAKASPDAPFSTKLEITGRDFGAAALKAPALGPDVAVAVLRSET
jgi:hypothetical protein